MPLSLPSHSPDVTIPNTLLTTVSATSISYTPFYDTASIQVMDTGGDEIDLSALLVTIGVTMGPVPATTALSLG
jgi:hypothetical protein